MLRSFLISALRAISRRPLFSFINISGLTVAFTSVLLITLYITHEKSYDTFHARLDNIYRAKGTFKYGDQDIQTNSMSTAFGPRVSESSDQIEAFCRFYSYQKIPVLSESGKKFLENHFMFADGEFLEIFDFKLISGNSADLYEPGKVFITPPIAQKYFGSEEPVGKTIIFDGNVNFVVAGLIQEAPSHSSITFNFLTSLQSLNLLEDMESQMDNEKIQLGMFQTYFLMRDGADVESISEGILKFADVQDESQFQFEPLSKVHLTGVYSDQSLERNLIIMGSIGGLILFLALVNYINLTTVSQSQRSKEIGIRKVIGAGIRHLSIQFLIEALIMILFSSVLSFGLLYIILPQFQQFLGVQISAEFIFHPVFLWAVISIVVGSILISSVYPIYVVLKFELVKILKGKKGIENKKSFTRKALISFQFAITIGLVLSTLIIARQINHIKSTDIGLTKEQTLVLNLGESSGSGYQETKRKLENISGVEKTGLATNGVFKGYSMFFTKIPNTEENLTLVYMSMDRNTVDILGLEFIERSDQVPMEGNLLINEAARDKLGLKENLFTEKIVLGRTQPNVHGVVRDFSYSGPESEIKPLSISIFSDTARHIHKYGAQVFVKLSENTPVGSTLAEIKTTINEYQPDEPFDYYFLDDAFNAFFTKEERLASMFKAFSMIGISIALLGLFGLVSFTLLVRIGELGIRKVLGATEKNLIMLISKEYVGIIVVSSLIALPVSLYAMDLWVQNFKNQINFGWFMPLLSVTIVFVVALGTVALKTWMVIRSNILRALKEN